MGTSVGKVFALQENLRPTGIFGQPFGEIKPRGPTREFAQVLFKLPPKFRITNGAFIFRGKLLHGYHECFRHIRPAIGAKMAE